MIVTAIDARAFAGASDHICAELNLLDLRLRRQVLRLRAAQLLTEDQFRGLYVADHQVDALLHSRPGHHEAVAELSDLILAEQFSIEQRAIAAERAGVDLPVLELQRRCELERLDVELLFIAAAPELELRYHTIYAYVQNDVARHAPSVDLALQLLSWPEERPWRQSAFGPEAPLIRNRLIRLIDDPGEKDGPLIAQSIRTDSRVVEALSGRHWLDPLLNHVARRIDPVAVLDDLLLPSEIRSRVENLVPLIRAQRACVIVQGPRGSGRKTLVEAICGRLRVPLIMVDASVWALPPDLARLLRREALLSDAVIAIDAFEHLGREPGACRIRQELADELLSLNRPVFLISTEGRAEGDAWRQSPQYCIALPRPDRRIRGAMWKGALGREVADDVDISQLATCFELTGGQIRNVTARARNTAALQGSKTINVADLRAAVYEEPSQSLLALAQRIEPRYEWSDLILPARVLQQLRRVCVSLEFRRLVYDDWGFQRRVAARGLPVLLSGPSGTGKTMAASIIARQVGMEMYRVDLSTIVSKYIGETEKNLDKVFQEAQWNNVILFFDEADALFGKRSEVKDSHDRYANLDIAYLLQRLETHEGAVVLATNLCKNIDEAFARRMQHTVEFPFPDASHRERIWKSMLPPEAPRADDIDFSFLSRQFQLSGGNIRNVVLTAAFGAASEHRPIAMRHLIAATARELEKIGRLPSKSDFRHYYELIREYEIGGASHCAQ